MTIVDNTWGRDLALIVITFCVIGILITLSTIEGLLRKLIGVAERIAKGLEK